MIPLTEIIIKRVLFTAVIYISQGFDLHETIYYTYTTINSNNEIVTASSYKGNGQWGL